VRLSRQGLPLELADM